MKMYKDADFESMDTSKLVRVIMVLIEGRQYDGIEADKERAFTEIKARLVGDKNE